MIKHSDTCCNVKTSLYDSSMICQICCIICITFLSSTLLAQPSIIKNNTKSISPKIAVKQLLKIDYFAFGGVGEAGEVSEGEKLFRIILSSQKRKEYFEAILFKGNFEAKLYALCGLREIDSNIFHEKIRSFTDSTIEVSTMVGCISGSDRFLNLVRDLSNGKFDFFIRRKQSP